MTEVMMLVFLASLGQLPVELSHADRFREGLFALLEKGGKKKKLSTM